MELFKQLSMVHRDQLWRFVYTPDSDQFNMPEYWMRPVEIPDPPEILRGDRDDFALACRKQLRQAGINNNRLVFCYVETGGGHLVCEVEGWILDNRQRQVMRRDDIPYAWLKISGYHSGDPWRRIKT